MSSVIERLKGLLSTVDPGDVEQVLRGQVVVYPSSNAVEAIAAETPVFNPRFAGVIESIYWLPLTALATNGTNYLTLAVFKQESTDYTTSTLAASHTTSDATPTGTAMVTLTPWALDLVAAQMAFSAGDSYSFKITDEGTTVDVSGALQINYRVEDA